MSDRRRLAVVGGGWAGLAAAVRAVQRGHAVTVFEMAPHWGGRARSTGTGSNIDTPTDSSETLDNGQHILIGAYHQTLALMRTVGADPQQLLLRQPLALRWADGRGLSLRSGPAVPAFARAVLGSDAWTWPDKLRLLAACGGWARSGFRCQPDRSVAELCASLPAAVRERLIDPLCVAALNTPAPEASATVFLRVLRDGLFGGRGACDLLLPRAPLHALLPSPARRWLVAQGARLRGGQRVMGLQPSGGGWQVDGDAFDAMVLACSATEAARLAAPWAPAWARQAKALRFEPIVTVYLRCPAVRLPLPMLALREGPSAPAQFVFDHGRLNGVADRFAFVISGAAPWVTAGQAATVAAVQAQAAAELQALGWRGDAARVEHVVAERRATFRCTPGLQRPPAAVAAGLVAAADYVQGPYPATLEGAVQAGFAAAEALDLSAMQNTVSVPSSLP